MKDRQISKDEINRITEKTPSIREKAFFTIMRQSGLPPHTIKQLRIGDVEGILEPNTPIPCRIATPHEEIPTFVGHEAVNYLKQYLQERPNLKQGSLLFTIRDKPEKEINTKDVSRSFRRAVQSLQRANKIVFEPQKGKPAELRLYGLKKFYEENAESYLSQLAKITTPKNDEYYRELYRKEAMPNLEIELPTPIQIHQLRERLAKIEKTVQETYMPVRRLYYELTGIVPEEILAELKPDKPEKNEQDNQNRIQKTLDKLTESVRKEENK